jgi:hypothetical protein
MPHIDTGFTPAGRLLAAIAGSSGMRGRHLGFAGLGLWLWPLPPAAGFEFAVEWPFGGIGLDHHQVPRSRP